MRSVNRFTEVVTARSATNHEWCSGPKICPCKLPTMPGGPDRTSLTNQEPRTKEPNLRAVPKGTTLVFRAGINQEPRTLPLAGKGLLCANQESVDG